MTETTIERHPDGAQCEFCERRMLKAKSCIPHAIVYELDDDNEPTDWEAAWTYRGTVHGDGGEDRCPDCGTTPGGYHHPGCDIAKNPRNGRQLIGSEFVEYRGLRLTDDEEGR